jgi:hypothetical protein
MVRGQSEIIQNLKQQHSILKRGLYAGVIDVSTTIENISNSNAPRETGFLRISSFSSLPTRGEIILGRVGYTAAYAAYVHEMPGHYNYTTPGTGPKFLEKAAKNNVGLLNRTFLNTVKRFIQAWR